jgi:hypothetical protein
MYLLTYTSALSSCVLSGRPTYCQGVVYSAFLLQTKCYSFDSSYCSDHLVAFQEQQQHALACEFAPVTNKQWVANLFHRCPPAWAILLAAASI